MNIHFDIYGLVTAKINALPYVSEGILARFPSPATDYIGDRVLKYIRKKGGEIWLLKSGTDETVPVNCDVDAKVLGIVTFSSNYEFYGDLSNRIHSIFSSYTLNYERYSIDEGFLDLTGMEGFDFDKLGRDIIRTTNRHSHLSGHRSDESVSQGRQQACQER